MIHSTESGFTHSGPKASSASRASHRSQQTLATSGRPRGASASSPSFIFTEPQINSLWDIGLLDRLSSPLTRYHE